MPAAYAAAPRLRQLALMSMAVVLRLGVALVAVFLVDRLLLFLESKGWINYRRRGLLRGGASYHSLTLQSIFDPAAENLQDARFEQIEERDDSGDPPPPASFANDDG